MFNIKKFLKGLKIVPKTTLESDQKGELEVRDSDGKLVHHNGSTRSAVVTEDHASTGADRLKNKELDSASVKIVDGTDTTKKVSVDASSAVTSTETVLDFNQTANRTIIFPDADTTLVGRNTTDTLTSKSIDADNNTITNLEVDNLKVGVLDIDLTSVSGADDTLPSAKAVKTYVDNSVAGKDEASEISYDNATSGLTATDVQAAIDEVEGRVDTAETNISNNATAISDHLADAVDAHDASAISFNNATSGLTATEVQAAIDEVEGRLDTAESSISTNASNLTTHESDTSTHGITSAIVGTDEAQTLINKTITGASIQTPIRSDVKQDTLANLQTYASTASNGQLVFATDVKKMFQVKDSALSEVSGGGSLDVFNNEDFETLSATSFSSGNNSSYLTAGTFGGTLSNETGSPISKNQSPKYTAGASSTNDWFDVKTINVDEKQKGEWIGVTLYADMSNFSTDVDFVVYDRTNSAVLTSTGLDILVGGSDKQRYSFAVQIPSTCSQISFGCQMKVAPVNTESFIFDDVEFSLNPFQYKDLVETSIVRASGNGGTSITNDVTNIDFTEVFDSHSAWNGTQYVVQNSNSVISISGHVLFTASLADAVEVYVNGTKIKRISNVNSITNKPFNAILDNLTTGDLISFRFTGSGTLSNDSTLHHLTITETWTKEHVVTPMSDSTLPTTAYTPVFEALGAVTNVDVFYKKVDDVLFIRGFASTGTVTASDITISLPSGYEIDYNNASVSSRNPLGYGIRHNTAIRPAGEAAQNSIIFADGVAANKVYISRDTFADNTSFPKSTGSGTFANNDGFSFWFQVPIKEDRTQRFLAAVPVEQVAYIKDIKTSGTNGGNSSINTVQTRDLNTIAGDLGIVSLSSNQFTLKSGKYDISASCPAFQVDQHQAFLYNVTDSIYQIDGSCEYSETGNMVGTNRSFVDGVLTITKNTVFELRHWTSDGVTSGLGVATDVHSSNPQSGEVYSVVKIRKLR